MGWWSLVGAGGPVLGVSLGSPIIQYFGWRSLFWIQLVLLVLAFCVVAGGPSAPPRRRRGRWTAPRRVRAFRTMDWVGLVVAVAVGDDAHARAVARPRHRLAEPRRRSCAGPRRSSASWSSSVASGPRRTRSSRPRTSRRATSRFPIVLRCSANFAYFGAFFLAPLLMELGYGFSYTKVGLVSIARPLTFAVCSPIAGYAAVKIGERTTAIVGAAALCALARSCSRRSSPSTPLAWLIVALALSGFAMGVAMPATSSIMANEVAESDFGVMSAAQILAMQVGEVAGIQVLATLQQGIMHHRGLTRTSDPAQLLATFHMPFLVGAGLAGVALVAALLPALRADAARARVSAAADA